MYNFSFLTLLLFLALVYPTKAIQTNPAGELNQLLDSTKFYFETFAAEKGIKLATETKVLSSKLKDRESLKLSTYYLGAFNFEIRNLDESEKSFIELEKLSRILHDTLYLIKSVSGQANLLAVRGETLNSILKNTIASDLAKDYDDDIYFGILSNMSVPLTKMMQYEKVLKNLVEALNHYKKSPDNEHALAIINNNIGELYREHLNNHEQAHLHYARAIALNNKIKDEFQIAKNYNNIGLNFKSSGEMDSAIFYLEKSKVLKEKIGDIGGLAIAHFNIGELQNDLGNYRSAVDHFVKTLSISTENGITEGCFYAYLGLGKAFTKLSEPRKSLHYLDSAAIVLQKLNNYELEIQLDNAYYDYFKSKGEYLSANLKLERIQEKKDSLNHLLMTEGFNDLRIVYEKELAEADLALQVAKESETMTALVYQKKINSFYIFTAILLVAMISVLFLALRERQKKLNVEKSTNDKLRDVNYRLSQQQIKLGQLNNMKDKIFSVLGHDLRSPLASILTYLDILEASKETEDEDKEMLEYLGNDIKNALKTLENVLSWSRQQMGEKGNERHPIDVVSLLKEVEDFYYPRARAKGIKLNISVNSSETFIADVNQIRSIVNNLISNAIKFSSENDIIDVTFRQKDKEVFFVVSDRGSGIPRNTIMNLNDPLKRVTTLGTKGEKGTGIGLSIVKDFVELNDGKLSFENNVPKGTNATITFQTLKEEVHT